MALARSLFSRHPGKWPGYTKNATGMVALFACVCILMSPLLAPNDPYEVQFLLRLQPPSVDYPLGTDAMGRCLLSRLLYGAQLTTGASLVVVVLASAIGTLIGSLSGLVGGWVDHAVMRLCEAVSVLPALAISMIIAGFLGLGLKAVIIALAAVHWTDYARLARNIVTVERQKTYVTAAEALGLSRWQIGLRHLLPNFATPLLSLSAYSLSWVILSFAGLSFLGLGVEPGTPEWGRMIAEARTHMRSYPRLVLAPGLTIVALILVVNLLGDVWGDRLRNSTNNHLTIKD